MASRLRKLAYGGAIVGSAGLFANWIWDDLHSRDRVRLTHKKNSLLLHIIIFTIWFMLSNKNKLKIKK